MAEEKKNTKAKDPEKKAEGKNAEGKKAPAKKAAAKRPAVKQTAAKNPAAKKTDAKKTDAKKPAAKKTDEAKAAKPKAEGKQPAKKPAAKKEAAKKRTKPGDKSPGGETSAPKRAAQPSEAKPKEKSAPPMVRARASYVRIAPRKARLVADQVRGLPIDDARTLLRFSPRTAARDIAKLIDSAAANAENNHDLVADDLVITDITVDEGPTLRRYRPRAMGRATRINKRTSHIKVALTPED